MNVIRRKGKSVTVEDFKKAYDKMIIKEKKDEVTGMFV
jgi:ATP-dependent 26S proteasome regulatory subunit